MMNLFSKKKVINVITFIVGKDQRVYETIRGYADSIMLKGTITEVSLTSEFTTITIHTTNNVNGIKYSLNLGGVNLHVAGNTVIVYNLKES